MSTPFKPIQTAEITWRENLPYSVTFDDIYFSNAGAIGEAQHVFVDGNQLIRRWQALTNAHFVIGETGFGSGLNFLLTWSLWQKYAPASARLHFISCEKNPFTREDLSRCLALWPELQEQGTQLLASYPVLTPGFHLLQFTEGRVNLTLMLGDALECYRERLICGDPHLEQDLRDDDVDAWFLDGFSPSKNPAIWSEPLFTTMAMLSNSHTTLATYSAAGVVQRRLQAAGFRVNKKLGYGCKREMIVAEFVQVPSSIGVGRYTPWHATSKTKATPMKRAMILGAGLAGCYTAYALARRGWSVTLLDAQERMGMGASGNHHAIFYPQLSSFRSPLNDFMLAAYLFAIRCYQNLLHKCSMGKLTGILQLAYNQREHITQTKLSSWLTSYPELGVLVNAAQASSLTGLRLQEGGLFIPQAGWLNSPILCQYLTTVSGIDWVPNTTINSLHHDAGEWHADEYHADVLILANGYNACQFSQTAHLPLKAIRGQMTSILSNEESERLQIPLCGAGHVLPARDGIHGLGATYHINSVNTDWYATDDADNLAKLNDLPIEQIWSKEIIEQWVGIRAATPDYLPLVGPVVHAELFKQQFAGLVSNSKRWIPTPAVCHEGLYICAGFGSRGLATIPLSAERLAAAINREPCSLPRSIVQSLSPARFLRRELIRVAQRTV